MSAEYDYEKNYKQPLRDFVKRYLNNGVEDVDFVPKSKVRVWYNFQVEGYPLHRHSPIEVVIPVENGYKYIADGRKFHLNEGDILFIPPNTLHEIECDSEGKRFIYLFEMEFIKSLYNFSDLENFLSEPRLVNQNTYPDIHKKIYNLLIEIADEYFMQTGKVNELSIFANLISIFSIIAKEETQTNSISFSNEKQRENFYKFKSLISYVNTHYMDDISLEYAAAYVGFSKYHFARLFKEFTDSSFYDYLCHRRILAAKSFLEDDSFSISEVGKLCGFSNQSTFTRSFSAHCNCTPSKYRQMIRQKRG